MPCTTGELTYHVQFFETRTTYLRVEIDAFEE